MLFKNEAMLQKPHDRTKEDGKRYQALGQLLSKDEPDVLNAAGAMASLVMFTHPEMYMPI